MFKAIAEKFFNTSLKPLLDDKLVEVKAWFMNRDEDGDGHKDWSEQIVPAARDEVLPGAKEVLEGVKQGAAIVASGGKKVISGGAKIVTLFGVYYLKYGPKQAPSLQDSKEK